MAAKSETPIAREAPVIEGTFAEHTSQSSHPTSQFKAERVAEIVRPPMGYTQHTTTPEIINIEHKMLPVGLANGESIMMVPRSDMSLEGTQIVFADAKKLAPILDQINARESAGYLAGKHLDAGHGLYAAEAVAHNGYFVPRESPLPMASIGSIGWSADRPLNFNDGITRTTELIRQGAEIVPLQVNNALARDVHQLVGAEGTYPQSAADFIKSPGFRDAETVQWGQRNGVAVLGEPERVLERGPISRDVFAPPQYEINPPPIREFTQTATQPNALTATNLGAIEDAKSLSSKIAVGRAPPLAPEANELLGYGSTAPEPEVLHDVTRPMSEGVSASKVLPPVRTAQANMEPSLSSFAESHPVLKDMAPADLPALEAFEEHLRNPNAVQTTVKPPVPVAAETPSSSSWVKSAFNSPKVGTALKVGGAALTAGYVAYEGYKVYDDIKRGDTKGAVIETTAAGGSVVGGVIGGMATGAAAGTVLGIESGPGALLTGAAGAVVGGFVGEAGVRSFMTAVLSNTNKANQEWIKNNVRRLIGGEGTPPVKEFGSLEELQRRAAQNNPEAQALLKDPALAKMVAEKTNLTVAAGNMLKSIKDAGKGPIPQDAVDRWQKAVDSFWETSDKVPTDTWGKVSRQLDMPAAMQPNVAGPVPDKMSMNALKSAMSAPSATVDPVLQKAASLPIPPGASGKSYVSIKAPTVNALPDAVTPPPSNTMKPATDPQPIKRSVIGPGAAI